MEGSELSAFHIRKLLKSEVYNVVFQRFCKALYQAFSRTPLHNEIQRTMNTVYKCTKPTSVRSMPRVYKEASGPYSTHPARAWQS